MLRFVNRVVPSLMSLLVFGCASAREPNCASFSSESDLWPCPSSVRCEQLEAGGSAGLATMQDIRDYARCSGLSVSPSVRPPARPAPSPGRCEQLEGGESPRIKTPEDADDYLRCHGVRL